MFENCKLAPLDMYDDLAETKFIVSSQKEEFISIQSVNKYQY